MQCQDMEALCGSDFPVLIVLYDFRYMWKDNREISVKKGEKLLLIEKTNRDWWQVVRPTERKSFFVPAQYVELMVKRKQETENVDSFSGFSGADSVLYENLDNLKPKLNHTNLAPLCKSDIGNPKCNKPVQEMTSKESSQKSYRQKPIPKTRTKVSSSKNSESWDSTKPDSSDALLQRVDSDNKDKPNISDKNKHDFILNLPKELSALQDGGKIYRNKSSPVAENLVYCNVLVGANKNSSAMQKVKSSGLPNKVNVDTCKNRMKNSYNLNSKSSKEINESRNESVEKGEAKQGFSVRNEKLQLSQTLSKSLEKLAEEIQFEPKKVSGLNKRVPENFSKAKISKMPKDSVERKAEKKGKTNDASIILDENKIQPQSRSMFSRFRRSLHHSNSFKSNNLKKIGKNSKKACELSLSWEGGLDKIQEKKENNEKPPVTPLGLQRSRTFMFPERSPLSLRPANKIFSGKHRLDTAYHSQRKPDEKVTLSTFKPIFNLDANYGPDNFPERKAEKQAGSKNRIDKQTAEMISSGFVKGKTAKATEKNAEMKNETDSVSNSEPKNVKMVAGQKGLQERSVGRVLKNAPEQLHHQPDLPASEGLAFYSEPYSNSESEDNLEEKSLTGLARGSNKIISQSVRSPNSIDSNLTVSEGTEASESDENDSLEFTLETPRQIRNEPANKRRTSLVRNSRVESSKVRKVAARLPQTPPPDQKPLKDLGEGWGQYISKGGRSYYYNIKTREKNWKPPRKIMSPQDIPHVGSYESVYSDANRSNTSSPLNDSVHLQNSLNRSNGLVHSKSTSFENSSLDASKSGSRWKEDSPDDFNRSSYNSSPVTGLSQSSSYSLNKSSRDSLNRFSPIDNIPSDEEGLELNDHVYKDDAPIHRKMDVSRQRDLDDLCFGGDIGKTNQASCDVSTFRIKPGWEEFYDDTLDQIYYIHKDRKEKNSLQRIGLSSDNHLLAFTHASESPVEFSINNLNSFIVQEKPPPVPHIQKKCKMNQRRRVHRSVQPGLSVRHPRKSVHTKPKRHVGGVKAEPKCSTITKSLKPQESEFSMSPEILETTITSDYEVADKGNARPLPFPTLNPELEYEINELLMMQRVTESSKTRRRIPAQNKYPLEISNDSSLVKNILDVPLRDGVDTNRLIGKTEKAKTLNLDKFIEKLSVTIIDSTCQNKVKRFLEGKFKNKKYETGRIMPFKLREDVIIDWENDYDNLNEPVVLEGKPVPDKRFSRVQIRKKRNWKNANISQGANMSGCCELSEGSATNISDINSFDGWEMSFPSCSFYETFHESNGQSEMIYEDVDSSWQNSFHSPYPELIALSGNDETGTKLDAIDETSARAMSPDRYLDCESDLNETAESCCNENNSLKSISPKMSGDAESQINFEEHGDIKECEHFFVDAEKCINSIKDAEEVEGVNFAETRPNLSKIQSKSLSEVQFRKNLNSKYQILRRSKSSDFFRDTLTEKRMGRNGGDRDSVSSDLCEWMKGIRRIVFMEDPVLSEDGEWILSFDSEERAYFFEETSKKSLWALPDYSNESSRPESNFSIQRSATESAINNDTPTKLRQSKDGDKASRVSGSTRSSKAQSMLIDPKFDISSNNGSKAYSMPRDLSKVYGEIIHIGVLNKTKILENGKKLRKNWTPAFVVLTESYLFFFKDAKSFQNIKNVINSNNNLLCLSLQGAVIEKADKISSRKNVYRISCSDNTDVLIQTEKNGEAEEWFKEISTVIQSLPQEPSAVSGSPLLDSSSPSKVGRTKSLKVKNKETGSMEDLSACTEDRQNKIRAKLKKFFIRRPTVDSLKKKGIWKDEPVFGCSLEQITKNRNPRVPIFVEKCIECIESKEENMKTDGLYRASGNLSQVQKIRLEVDQNNLNIMKDEEDVHVLTGSLKLFFRELKEPLIPSKQLEPALLATDKQVRKERIKDFQKIVKSLPLPNYDTLKFLLQHLLRVKEFHRFNRMNINNLAIVFGPTLMWPEQESANMALELMQQNVVIECLLKEFQEIFT